jgi:hypothetical protein
MAEVPEDALDADLKSAEFHRGVERGFWRLMERVGVRLYIEVHAWSGDTYLLELTCDQYLEQPCLGKFVHPTTRACTEAAWPRGDGPFGGWFKWDPGNLFICWPGDRGGIGYHPEWRALQHWKRTANPLVQYLEFIRQCLMIPGRGYRPRIPCLPLAS